MKRTLAYALTAALLAACSTQEKDFQIPAQDDAVFYASFEQPVEEGTKVYANEDLLLRWTADDRVSIFNKNTYNQEYRFIGETGDYEGGFNKVGDPEFITGKEIPHVVSVYPYQRLTRVTEDETVHVTLPAEQPYAENSFGLGANTMLSVSTGNLLYYKNVGGYLMLKLYGDGVSVSSITLKGNNGEKLAGNATVTMPVDGDPSVSMASDASTEITLTCETPVQLGATEAESTQFWFVVPAVAFSKGFTVTVSGDGGVFEKTTDKSLTIERNNLSKMSPIAVKLSQPKNVIYYTSVDGNVVTPANPDAFGASIVSNEYVEGVGTITFDGDVTSIGDYAFYCCTGLTSITIPKGVTSIRDLAFNRCSSLTNITIPDSVTSIGDYAFYGCTSLAIITIPDSVTSIGNSSFHDCRSLTSIMMSDSVTSIGDYAFYGCTSLASITISDSVTGIGDYVFYDCTSLASITIPDSVTIIGDYAFYGCTSLTSITIPDSVTSIGDSAFCFCTGLSRITISDSVTSIGDSAFYFCTALTSITIPDSVTSIGDFAFDLCTGLSRITIPNSVTSIGNNAFSDCSSLTHILIPDSVTSIGNGVFGGCLALMSFSGKFATPDGLFLIDCGNIIAVALGAVNEEFIFPDGVTSIGGGVFFCCTSLTSVTIPDSVTSIGDGAFSVCTSLTNITIPDSVTSIGNNAFSDCTSLTRITIKPKVPPTGGENMFFNTNNAPICVPDESADAYKSAQHWSDYADRIKAISSSFTIRDFAQEYVKILDVWQNNVGEVVMHPDAPDETVANAHFVPATTTITVGGKTYNTADMLETALRSYLLIRGYNGLDTEKYGKNSIPALEGGAVSMSETEIPETHGYEWGSSPFNEISSNGGHLVMGTENENEHCKVKVDILDNWAMRSLNFQHGKTIVNLCGYASGQLDGYYGCFCSQRALITYAFFFKFMLATNLDKGTEVSLDQIIRSELFGDEMCYPEAIDLGLPSGLKWASFNLGATKPEENGDYYAWGETEPYYISQDPLIWRTGKENGYNWTSYKWCMGASNTLTKYCSRSYCGYEGYTDTKTELDPQDDAAHVNLGGNWRVPTDEEWSELMDNCTWTWTNKNGVVGYLVTADNGNIIFLPAAGVRFNAGLLDVGSYGSYWCSSLHTDNPCNAFSMFFSSSNVYRGNPDRRYGFPVRPVTE